MPSRRRLARISSDLLLFSCVVVHRVSRQIPCTLTCVQCTLLRRTLTLFVCTTGKILCAKTCWVGGAVVVLVEAGLVGRCCGVLVSQKSSLQQLSDHLCPLPYNFLSNKIHLLAFFGGFFVGGGSHAARYLVVVSEDSRILWSLLCSVHQ